jgi:hypothetical protein
VALVLGVNTGVLPELAALADPAGIDLAEGAFLVALARQSLARAHGWPVLAELEPCSWSQSPAVRPGTSFRAADGILTLLRRTLMPRSLTGHHRGCLG